MTPADPPIIGTDLAAPVIPGVEVDPETIAVEPGRAVEIAHLDNARDEPGSITTTVG